MKRTIVSVLKRGLIIGLISGLSCGILSCSWWKEDRPDRGRAYGRITGRQVDAFLSQVQQRRENPDSHYLLGRYYQRMGRHREAIREFEKAVAIRPDHAQAYDGMGVSHDMQGEFSSAVASYEKALRIDPSSDHTYNNLGYSYLLQGRPQDAETALNQAVALNGGKNRVHNNRGMAYAMLGKDDLAWAEFAKTGDQAMAHGNLAGIQLGSGRIGKAKEHFAAALMIDPSYADAREGLDRCNALLQAAAAEKREERVASVEASGIELSNGNGVRNMARTMGRYLKDRGYNVVRFTNADHFNHARARIYYSSEEYIDTVRRLAGEFPGEWQFRKVDGFDRPGVKVKVLLGKNLIRYRENLSGGANS